MCYYWIPSSEGIHQDGIHTLEQLAVSCKRDIAASQQQLLDEVDV
jgi:S-ribosylhomocysteine lyase LuxS involved in autoinducer biosynthesis